MEIIFFTITAILIILSFLPVVPSSHRIFRVAEYGRIQISYLLLLCIISSFFISFQSIQVFWWTIGLLLVALASHLIVLIPYTSLWSSVRQEKRSSSQPKISILNINVYQFNEKYQALIDLINDKQPDIILTMESNQNWEEALNILDGDYPHSIKYAQENTYGMHIFSKIPIIGSTINFFVAEDVPSFEISFQLEEEVFHFFGLHPPPPSPTEEKTSKERDGEILAVADKILELQNSVLVAGDFNNVAWSKSSKLFRKITGLIDPRIGRGFVPTFHADYWFMRFPIDLFFHSKNVFIDEFKTLPSIGSDHLPLWCSFHISSDHHQIKDREDVSSVDKQTMEEYIEEGKNEKGDREGKREK